MTESTFQALAAKEIEVQELKSENCITINAIQNIKLGDTLTIESGEITISKSYHKVDTESEGATDDLNTINGGTTGDVIYIQAATSSRTVVLKHATGNILNQTNLDVSLDTTNAVKEYFYNGTFWIETGGRVA